MRQFIIEGRLVTSGVTIITIYLVTAEYLTKAVEKVQNDPIFMAGEEIYDTKMVQPTDDDVTIVEVRAKID